ncbi:hypothetical protein A1O1_07921 [Capronia coronata CBS 617.96]|uniref:trans-L-3-hydroxyproline dehydratase n=1 Tax=Capronia coronata CBS 617.96 TaxID=1182541 RepID=W9XY51_9EURO|nr:uncharacterized protein A1O1_07921 [Capronia coronata CBS 617.96]EXJ81856.1 hypothetical protein A1O1_07921 [Capronia coronata CBS 617.96]
MDALKDIVGPALVGGAIKCIDMHTTGEPTRIVYSGFPRLKGTLLEQREQASQQYDHIRKRLLLEPRGHWDMYGAILVLETEQVSAGKADMGVLFMHNQGFSMMCGHATIALGRFLVDAHESIFPARKTFKVDKESSTIQVNLHVPCGIISITVPVLPHGRSDPHRPVSFVSVPSFASGISVRVPLSDAQRWPELGGRTSVVADFAYGGVFYCLIDARELGFRDGLIAPDIARMSFATKLLKDAINGNPELAFCTKHPDMDVAAALYSVLVVDAHPDHHASSRLAHGGSMSTCGDHETGLCFFANQQIDRSPTGGGVAARAALAYTTGRLAEGQRRCYHSLLSRSQSGRGSFSGTIVQVLSSVDGHDAHEFGHPFGHPLVRVRIEGQAFYTGLYTAVVEEGDTVGATGFSLSQLTGEGNR